MSLFPTPINAKKITPSLDLLKLCSPIGDIFFDALIDRISIMHTIPNQALDLNNNGLLLCWQLHNCQLEFIKINLPLKEDVDCCVCGLWRVKSLMPCAPEFKCFINNAQPIEGSPETGEHLFAKSWVNSRNKLTIGTEDEEALIQRAEFGEWLPYRFKSVLDPDNLKFLENGLHVSFPKLNSGECLQAQFIISWNSNLESIATWLAVDQQPQSILDYLGIVENSSSSNSK